MGLKDFSFEKLGKSMDEDIRVFRQKFKLDIESNAQEKETITMGDIVRDLLKRTGKDVTLQSIDSEFEYNDLIDWVSKNATGNKFYVVKVKLENSSDGVLCVFFSKDDTYLTGESYPKICYVFKTLNPTIDDLFPNGKYIYVKSFKIV